MFISVRFFLDFHVEEYLQVHKGFMLKLPSPVLILELTSRKIAFNMT